MKSRGRKADHLKLSRKNLFKPMQRLVPTRGPMFAGTSARSSGSGPHMKLESSDKASKEKSEKKGKLKYVAPHFKVEYFALEILLRLGIETPKARISSRPEWGSYIKDGIIITNSLNDYIPIIAIRHDIDTYVVPEVREIRERYELDIANQVILDHEEKKAYRISGNLFSSDIAGLLVIDKDFQPDGYNLGVIKDGNRFYAAAIDKEKSRLYSIESLQDFQQLLKSADGRIEKSHLYQSREPDQVIAMVAKINDAMYSVDSGFYKIFDHERVKITPPLKEISEICLNNLYMSADLIIKHFGNLYGEDFLQQFSMREEIRNKIVDNLFMANQDMFNEYDNNQQLLIRANMIEDLRGPYYKALFADKAGITEQDINNSELLTAMMDDIRDELSGNLTSKYPSEVRPQSLQK